MSPIVKAGITHLYFESIHPFEDGNGRIGRALIEKSFAQYLKRPSFLMVSKAIEKNKKAYYCALESTNRSNHITEWLLYFADLILQAQSLTLEHLEFILKKTHFFDHNDAKLNNRQRKAILKIFDAGVEGFQGGLSAKNYISMTKASVATATRDLHDLVKKEIFTKTGSLKSTRYWLR